MSLTFGSFDVPSFALGYYNGLHGNIKQQSHATRVSVEFCLHAGGDLKSPVFARTHPTPSRAVFNAIISKFHRRERAAYHKCQRVRWAYCQHANQDRSKNGSQPDSIIACRLHALLSCKLQRHEYRLVTRSAGLLHEVSTFALHMLVW